MKDINIFDAVSVLYESLARENAEDANKTTREKTWYCSGLLDAATIALSCRGDYNEFSQRCGMIPFEDAVYHSLPLNESLERSSGVSDFFHMARLNVFGRDWLGKEFSRNIKVTWDSPTSRERVC